MARIGVILFLSCFCFLTEHCCQGSMFQSLTDYVKSQVQPGLVPQTNAAEPLAVSIRIGVNAIDKVDRSRNELHMRSWIFVSWNSSIAWNPADYNGLVTVLLPAQSGFVPRLTGGLSAGHHELLNPLKTRYLFNGAAMFFASARWRLSCDLSKGDHCTIRLYSPEYDSSVIRFHKNENKDVDNWTDRLRHKTGAYEIVSDDLRTGNDTIEGFPWAWDWIEYDFSFQKRRSGFHDGPMAIFKWT